MEKIHIQLWKVLLKVGNAFQFFCGQEYREKCVTLDCLMYRYWIPNSLGYCIHDSSWSSLCSSLLATFTGQYSFRDSYSIYTKLLPFLAFLIILILLDQCVISKYHSSVVYSLFRLPYLCLVYYFY